MKHNVEEVRLKNGARGLLIDVPGASVMNMKVQFRAGMRYARRSEIYEIAHVVEHLSFGANAQYKDEQAYEADFTKNGAYHNAWTSDFSVCYETECADFEWQRIMELKRVAICSPKFNEAELKAEKGNVRAELTGYMNDYTRLLWPRLQRAIGEEALSLPERIKTIGNIELKDIREHYRRTHTARNMRFIIAGRMHRRKREIIKMLEGWELKEGERFVVPMDELHAADAVLIRRKDASNITFGWSSCILRRLDEAETQAMCCLNHILTGTMSSKIFGQARKKGLVYEMGSGVSNEPRNTSWDFDGEVNVESAKELFDLIRSELGKILNGEITDGEVEAAKSYALGRYQMGAQTVGAVADYYMGSYFMNEEIEKYDKVPDNIKAIDKGMMVELAREFFGSGINALVAVGSVEKAVINDLAERLKI